VNAFSAAIADELAKTRSELWGARERRDDAGVVSALERLLDLGEIVDRAREGVSAPKGLPAPNP
jgi:hypothetical protein